MHDPLPGFTVGAKNLTSKQAASRQRDLRRAATGQNKHRMHVRAAKKLGITLHEYERRRKARTERAEEKLERTYEYYERRAKRSDIPDIERRAIASATTSAYIMRRYYTEPEFRTHMLQNSRRRNYRIRGAQITDKTSLEYIAERDNWKCHICGKKVTTKTWTVDHLIPLSKGGQDIEPNLALAHRRCNAKRGPGRLDAQLRLVSF